MIKLVDKFTQYRNLLLGDIYDTLSEGTTHLEDCYTLSLEFKSLHKNSLGVDVDYFDLDEMRLITSNLDEFSMDELFRICAAIDKAMEAKE